MVLMAGIALFAFFVPVVPSGGHIPSNCVFCPEFPLPFRSSLTYTFLGIGTGYNRFGYYLWVWGAILSL